MSETHVCRQCSADTEVTPVPHVEGAAGGVRVTMDGLEIHACGNGHRRFQTVDFPMRFIEGLLAVDDLVHVPPARKKGLFRKHLHCPDCGTELPAEPTGEEASTNEVKLADAKPIQVELHLPVFQCPKCRKSATLHAEGVQRGVMDAVADAFRHGDIQPG